MDVNAPRKAAPRTAVFAGACNVDHFMHLRGTFPRPGETVFGEASSSMGGKASNAAVAAGLVAGAGVGVTRATTTGTAGADTDADISAEGSTDGSTGLGGGLRVALIGAIGDDAAGLQVLAGLQRANVDCSCVSRVAGAGTGCASITVDGNGENTIIISAGANAEVTPARLESAWDAVGAASAGGAGAAFFVAQNEIPLDATLRGLAISKAAGALTIWNPSPVPQPLPSSFPNVDVLFVNVSEALALSRSTEGPETAPAAALEAAALALLPLVGVAVVLSAGASGALVASQHELITWVPPPPLQGPVVDTSGAGDCLTGAFVASLHEALPPGMPTAKPSHKVLVDCLKLACEAAAFSVQHKGCQTSYPSRNQL